MVFPVFGFGGNYGYNSRQQFGECTPVTKFVPLGVWLYPSTNFCTPREKVYPKKYRESLGCPLDKLEYTELSYTGVPTSIRFPSKS